MTLHRRNPKRDASEPAIVDALLAAGFSVSRLSGRGVPDLLLGKNGKAMVVECKGPKGQLTDDQQRFWCEFRGHRLIVLRTVDDALRLAKEW